MFKLFVLFLLFQCLVISQQQQPQQPTLPNAENENNPQTISQATTTKGTTDNVFVDPLDLGDSNDSGEFISTQATTIKDTAGEFLFNSHGLGEENTHFNEPLTTTTQQNSNKLPTISKQAKVKIDRGKDITGRSLLSSRKSRKLNWYPKKANNVAGTSFTTRSCKPGFGKMSLKTFGKDWGYHGPHYAWYWPATHSRYGLHWKTGAFKDMYNDKFGYLKYKLTKQPKSTFDMTTRKDGLAGNRYWWARRSPSMFLQAQQEIQFHVQSDQYHMFRLVEELADGAGGARYMGNSFKSWHSWHGISNPISSAKMCCQQEKMQMTIPYDGNYRVVGFGYDPGGTDYLYIPNDVNNNKRWDNQGFCRGCSKGQFSDTLDTGTCKKCPVGKYSDQGK